MSFHVPLVGNSWLTMATEEDFDAMCVASFSWAFATLGHWDGPLLEVIGAAVENRVASCKTQEMKALGMDAMA